MSLSTIAAARQKEIKLSIAVVATTTLGIGWAEPCVFVKEGSGGMLLRRLKNRCVRHLISRARFDSTKLQKRVPALPRNVRRELRARRKSPYAVQSHRNVYEELSSSLQGNGQPRGCPIQKGRHKLPDTDLSLADGLAVLELCPCRCYSRHVFRCRGISHL